MYQVGMQWELDPNILKKVSSPLKMHSYLIEVY